MAYLPREQRRAAIVDAALRVARRSGLAGITARTVGQEVGGSPGLIHQHFASMVELQAAAWRTYVAEQVDDFTTATRTPTANPVLEFFANHRASPSAPDLNLWADAWAHALRVPDFAPTYADSLDVVVTALQSSSPELGAIEAQRYMLLAVALAGMRRISPERYPPEVVDDIIADAATPSDD
ncbi:TetR family transcriptional regulator [Microbacterium esteraromaticum]|uniref:TetR/AcrR family transcriptional regulator n=1 Tax=Microbacterium esteraromaticum TaxID=57043 RepID=UPI001A908DBF|nr:TetR/AcrR family transcriptional regulator [Microbacterium esteraromaticum]MBN8425645.1 TetR family transcriptional regulator [Microbacterium esteraromaticum]